MSNQNETILGKLIDNTYCRDAIHIAVAPVKAMHNLKPGQHIGFVDNTNQNVGYNTVLLPAIKCIGIVDPFLQHEIKEGEWFYMLLYPRSITSLRHNWTHPEFSVEKEEKEEKEEKVNFDKHGSKVWISEAWLRIFAKQYKADYDEMIHAAITDTEYCFGGVINSEYFDKDSEFWKHIEIVTERKFSDEHKQNNNFRCAC